MVHNAYPIGYGKDTAQLYAGKDFPRQEYDCQLINLGWIEIEKKEGIDNVYIFIKEGTSEFRECGLHFSFLEGMVIILSNNTGIDRGP